MMKTRSIADIEWDKMHGLVPAIIQHAVSGAVLMLGYMSPEALEATRQSGHVTFWSRSKQRLWTKGESSGHVLEVRSIAVDCDGDTLLVLAMPRGPACHLGTATCFGEHPPQSSAQRSAFLGELDTLIAERIATRAAGSYTAKLVEAGELRIAQKVGEEGLELALAAAAQGTREVIGEAADLFYHTLLLLQVKGVPLSQVSDELEWRHARAQAQAQVASPG